MERPNTKATVFSREKRIYWRAAKQGNRRQSSDVSLHWIFEQDIYCGSRRVSGLRNDWWKGKGMFQGPLCRSDCLSRLFMGHMCKFREGGKGFRVLHMVDFWPMMGHSSPSMHCAALAWRKLLAGFFHICVFLLFCKLSSKVLFSHLPSEREAQFHCFILFHMLDIVMHTVEILVTVFFL